MSKFNNIFITVGTTEFDNLIEYCCSDEMIKVFCKLNCKNLTIQLGHGITSNYSENFYKFKTNGINFGFYELKSSIIEDILNADLVISHAGSGTCLDVLNSKKPLVVVINEELMDNHQVELAEQLASDGYLFYCTIQTLKNALENELDLSKIKLYEKGNNAKKFVEYLDNFMGF